MSSLDKLVKRRGTVKSKLTIFSKFVLNLEKTFPNKIITEQHLFVELEQRLERFLSLIDEFEDIQSQIDEVSDCDENERDAFYEVFYNNVGKAKTFLKICSSPILVESTNASEPIAAPSGAGPSSINSTNLQQSMQNVKLPVIQLPTFDGKYEHWLEFRDTFESLINQNSAITEIQKFHYLRASLSGGACQIIASLEFSSQNYTVAWDLICKRFNNSRILTHNHVKALFTLEKIHEESSGSLRKIIDEVVKHLRALTMLKEPTEFWDTLIIYLITTKLDSNTEREWEQKKASFNNPSLDNLKDFLKERADLLETLENNKSVKGFSKQRRELGKTKSFLNAKAYCPFCKKEHFIQNCPDFTKLNVHERTEEAKKIRLCLNCFRPGHMLKQCRSSGCKLCQARHNTMLHPESNNTTTVQSQNDAVKAESVNLSSQSVSNNAQVLLSTVLIDVFNQNGTTRVARALLDAGSQSSFITAEFCNHLRLPRSPINLKVCGLNKAESEIKSVVVAKIKSRYNDFTCRTSLLIVPRITDDLPNFRVDTKHLQVPSNIKLADPNYCLPGKVDILLGADCFWQILSSGQIKLTNQGLILQNTKLGWIVAGPLQANPLQVTHCNFSRDSDTNKQIERFWEIEEVSNIKPLSHEERLCESHFIETVRRETDGKFVVTIPLKESPNRLGESYEIAKKRLLSLERKFIHNPDLKAQYLQFINEYRDLGHMRKITKDQHAEISYYMPHHGVLKESSMTTKLRVVFDASCPTSTGYSFNDLQMVGPTIQSDLFTLLLRFRKYNYVVAADIEKMYRMCLVNPNQVSLQRILWRDSPEKPIDTYELVTVTYGTSSAAYLAIRCLYQLGMECQTESPRISEVIKHHFYVDDLVTGADTKEEAIFVANEVSRVLKTGGFTLRKWASNSTDILSGIDSNENISSVDFGANENTKTLGLSWNCQTDSFMYKINSNFHEQVTKRCMLSEIAQIFDPLGLLSPCIISTKMILQDLWCANLEWDDVLPDGLHTKWIQTRDELRKLNDMRIPRQVTHKNSKHYEIHAFSDASTKAYGACVYIKSQDHDGNILVRLVCAKSKVAPLKTQTVPRLELMAAYLSAQLTDKVKSASELDLKGITYWSDSTVVLGWLRMPPNLLQTFVANRVARILELSDQNHWRYVPTSCNPADYLSRGVKPNVLPSLELYWNGPDWLQADETTWPKLNVSDTELPELRNVTRSHKATTNHSEFLFENYSSLTRLERIIAYCLRFRANCFKVKPQREVGSLTLQEIQNASSCLIKLSQASCFSDEIVALQNGSRINARSKLLKLNPFLENNILRVGGRLANSSFPHDKKFPIVLSAKHLYTKLLFEREHKRLLYAGPQHLLSSIRDKFWPLGGRNLARKIVYDCVQCFRAKPRPINPIMGDLPAKRVNPAPPFYTTGVDYAGPFQIKDRNGRGKKVTKCYICLFICFLTRAIHLELVSDLTTDAFLATFRRFIARRGKPHRMYSDNGRNFVGADLELRSLGQFLQTNDKHLTDSIQTEGISWSFIPAHSPHFGGIWEAGVKSAKHHLRRIVGNSILTFEQFSTLLAQIESVLNSRPMSPLSSDPSDFIPLTPSHFLIGRPTTSVADPDVTQIPNNRLSHYQHVQQLYQHFWRRWAREYISEMQQRTKWSSQNGTLNIDDLVVIREDNQPPLKWSIGRIISIHPGKDGIARVATIKTPSGVIKRSFAKICPLPTN